MSIRDDLQQEVTDIFTGGRWDEEAATVIPAPTDLRLNSNHAKHLRSATVLYADIDQSINMVANFKWWFAAEVYKAYLRCAADIIRKEGGTITAFDGDHVMAVFFGDAKNTTAVRCAMEINYAVAEFIRPAIKAKYATTEFSLKHVIGIDTGNLHVARVGVHGDNDLVWVGRAANYAAKLCTRSDRPIWITKDVYDMISDEVKFANGVNMWTQSTWQSMANATIYGSTYQWWQLG